MNDTFLPDAVAKMSNTDYNILGWGGLFLLFFIFVLAPIVVGIAVSEKPKRRGVIK